MMQRVAAVAFLLLVGSIPQPGRAETASPAAANLQTGFTYCTVTDMSGGGMGTAKIWASPVFEFAYRADDSAGFGRGMELATEFHSFIGGMGGSGDKSCFGTTTTRAELEAIRNQHRADWTKRVLIWSSKWQDVAWTAKPWDPAAAVTAPANKYFYCYVTDVEPDVRKTVASLVFDMPVQGSGIAAGYDQAHAYAEEFKRTALPGHGVSDEGTLCSPHDSLAEAEKSRKEYRRLFSGFNLGFVDLAWRPSGQAAPAAPTVSAVSAPASATAAAQDRIGVKLMDVTAEVAQTFNMAARGAWVVEVEKDGPAEKAGMKPMDTVLEIAGQAVNKAAYVPAIVSGLRPGFLAPVRVWRGGNVQDISIVIPQPTANTAAMANATTQPSTPAAPPVEQSLYCTGFVMRGKPALIARAPVRKEASPAYNPATATATLSALVSAVQQANPGDWHDLSHIGCYDNDGVIASEKFCVVSTFKRFGGGTQMAGLFCNASREMIDKRWSQMVEADGGHAQIVPWPGSK